MSEIESIVPESSFHDRKSRLVALGIVQLCLGGLCAFAAIGFLLALGILGGMSQGGHWSENPFFLIAIVAFYLGLAVAFISLGAGCLRARRWARALTLVCGWIGLAYGVNSFASVAFTLPQTFSAMKSPGEIPAGLAVTMGIASLAFSAILHLGIPAVFILACRGRDVESTCAYYNPELSWTDRRPLPILALCIAYAMWVISLPMIATFGWLFPFFGRYLTGTSGAIAFFVTGLLVVYLIWGTWRLDIRTWYLSLVLLTAWALSSGITSARVDLKELYSTLNMSEEMRNILSQMTVGPAWVFMMYFSLVYGVLIAAGLIISTRRFYPDAASEAEHGY